MSSRAQPEGVARSSNYWSISGSSGGSKKSDHDHFIYIHMCHVYIYIYICVCDTHVCIHLNTYSFMMFHETVILFRKHLPKGFFNHHFL